VNSQKSSQRHKKIMANGAVAHAVPLPAELLEIESYKQAIFGLRGTFATMDGMPGYWLTRLVLQRGLGLVYLIAFLVVVNQFQDLFPAGFPCGPSIPEPPSGD
jgi:hypothetical protein